ncbi:uncharacterized protein LOC142139586 isoform X2 [Mixophyes fleayi]|uniref:uncharacterized protein LOC142139586 isoform X2 n=1 Tax=Mixophyes fleayi TaxID=3061075 RepID=UPI003F4D903A
MDVCGPAARKDWVLLCMLFAVTLSISPGDGHSSSCAPSINIPRNTKLSKSEGESLILVCPVRICSQELPNVTWCKIDKNYLCAHVIPGDGISSGWEEQKGNDAVYFLKFVSVQKNDSGFYRCSATYGEVQVMSGQIEISISAAGTTEPTSGNMTNNTNSTALSEKFVLYHFKLYLAIVLSLGTLCVMIIIVSLLVFCLRRRKENRRSSPDPVSTEEVKFVAASENPKNCSQQIKLESSSPLEAEFTDVSTEITYDNAHLSYKPTTFSAPESPEEEDSIIYADLNHETKKTSFRFQNDCEVEYGVMSLNRHIEDCCDS